MTNKLLKKTKLLLGPRHVLFQLRGIKLFYSNIFLLLNFESLDLSDNEGLTSSFPSSNLSNVLLGLSLSNTRISVYLENDLISNLKSLEYMFLN